MPFSSITITVTVTYNPDLEILRDQLESLKSRCKVIIVDNASKKELLKPIKEFSSANDHVKLISLDKNIGISCAQNIGIENVLQNHPEIHFVLLLDHDSLPPGDMVKKLEEEFEALVESGRNPGAIGPLLYDPRDNQYLGFHVKTRGLWLKTVPARNSAPIECHSLNSSGSLISVEALKKIGLLEKTFFMDHGETEWCFRAISKGYKIFGTAKVIMEHNMGDDICEYWLFGKKRMPYRPPLRHYYIARNSILLQKRSYVPLTWKFWNVIKILFTFLYFGFASTESREQRRYIVQGIGDGFKGVTGEYPDAG